MIDLLRILNQLINDLAKLRAVDGHIWHMRKFAHWMR